MFITEPQVELVGYPVIDIDGMKKFLKDHNYEWPDLTKKLDSYLDLGDKDAEWLVECAGRNCYQSWPQVGGSIKGRSHEDHIKNLIESGHGAVLEHSNFNFLIWNVSRTLSHELVRHRIGHSYSQCSQRYVDSSSVAFIIPKAIQELSNINSNLYQKWQEHCELSRILYSELTDALSEMYQDINDKLERRKKARQAARSVLPGCSETKIFVTMNGRSVRNFIEQRANSAAEIEIRSLAVKIFQIMQTRFPLIMHGIKLISLPDGTQAVESEFRKV